MPTEDRRSSGEGDREEIEDCDDVPEVVCGPTDMLLDTEKGLAPKVIVTVAVVVRRAMGVEVEVEDVGGRLSFLVRFAAFSPELSRLGSQGLASSLLSLLSCPSSS